MYPASVPMEETVATTDTPSAALVERTARQFHEAYERLAPLFGYKTREASAKPWEEVPEQNRDLMRAVCAEVLASLPDEPTQPSAALLEVVRHFTRHHGEHCACIGCESLASLPQEPTQPSTALVEQLERLMAEADARFGTTHVRYEHLRAMRDAAASLPQQPDTERERQWPTLCTFCHRHIAGHAPLYSLCDEPCLPADSQREDRGFRTLNEVKREYLPSTVQREEEREPDAWLISKPPLRAVLVTRHSMEEYVRDVPWARDAEVIPLYARPASPSPEMREVLEALCDEIDRRFPTDDEADTLAPLAWAARLAQVKMASDAARRALGLTPAPREVRDGQ